MVVEITDTPEQVENFIELVRSFGILELQRTGTIAIGEG
jgi:acetolactate synthase-1/3 small subunit